MFVSFGGHLSGFQVFRELGGPNGKDKSVYHSVFNCLLCTMVCTVYNIKPFVCHVYVCVLYSPLQYKSVVVMNPQVLADI